MGSEDEKGFKIDIPIVADRREFFEQEAVVAGPPEIVASDLEPDEVVRSLQQMRESAGRRTGSVHKEPEAPTSDEPQETSRE